MEGNEVKTKEVQIKLMNEYEACKQANPACYNCSCYYQEEDGHCRCAIWGEPLEDKMDKCNKWR